MRATSVDLRQHISTLADRFAALPEFTLESTDAASRALAGELGSKPGVVMSAARVAVTGQTVSPGLFETTMVLGREKTIERFA